MTFARAIIIGLLVDGFSRAHGFDEKLLVTLFCGFLWLLTTDPTEAAVRAAIKGIRDEWRRP